MNEHVDREILSALVDGECSPEERRYAHEHLQDCASCREAASVFGAVQGYVAELPRLVAPESFVATVLEPRELGGGQRLREVFRGPRRYAAVAVVAAGLAVSLAGLATPPPQEDPPVEMFMMRHVSVNDGSHVGGQVLFAVNNADADEHDR